MAYKNKAEQLQYQRDWYAENKDSYRKKANEWKANYRERNRAFVRDYLEDNPCVDCEEDDIYVLTFDHVRGEKRENISTMVRGGYGIESIGEEIEKCEVRCANCHMRRTANQFGWEK